MEEIGVVQVVNYMSTFPSLRLFSDCLHAVYAILVGCV